ncbi:50S ribosomal protein L6 [Candidatus Sneabacter namystus]|uniref:50S ribosomal protein L6 n=1 Tax=Candidatus Sneabacter namystus TaxID=2601646 RepID=A0A5C0UJJ5_9RICK|nr:50S ribosomal protein L6 [Candidatus Sneabacter namystus]QEK39781.1 50S ribosomal protein L6 [Candidatus Sneabacter namystus]
MSRVGKVPIVLPHEVSCEINERTCKVQGPKGNLVFSIPSGVKVVVETNTVFVSAENKGAIASYGTTRSIINNMVIGVSQGFEKEIEITGTGYKASCCPKYLYLALGKSHGICIEIPKDIEVKITKPTSVLLRSINKETLGQFAALVIRQRPTEPYKGTGVRIKNVPVFRKEIKRK